MHTFSQFGQETAAWQVAYYIYFSLEILQFPLGEGSGCHVCIYWFFATFAEVILILFSELSLRRKILSHNTQAIALLPPFHVSECAIIPLSACIKSFTCPFFFQEKRNNSIFLYFSAFWSSV